MTFAHSGVAAVRRRGHPSFAATVLFVGVLAMASQVNAAPTPELAGSNWRPIQVGSLRFGPDGKLTGRAGCNRFFGTFKVSGMELTLGPVGSTRMACHEPVMQRENAFFAALENTTSFRIEAGSLRFFDLAGMELARFVHID
jgi:heat shock protein HslJ